MNYAIGLAVILLLAAGGAWAFLPGRYLPGNRARHLRLRLHLRLHPGKGFATVFESVAAVGPVRRAAPLRPHPPLPALLAAGADPAGHSVFLGRAHSGMGCGCRWKSTCW